VCWCAAGLLLLHAVSRQHDELLQILIKVVTTVVCCEGTPGNWCRLCITCLLLRLRLPQLLGLLLPVLLLLGLGLLLHGAGLRLLVLLLLQESVLVLRAVCWHCCWEAGRHGWHGHAGEARREREAAHAWREGQGLHGADWAAGAAAAAMLHCCEARPAGAGCALKLQGQASGRAYRVIQGGAVV
jgi:hypothetical protein